MIQTIQNMNKYITLQNQLLISSSYAYDHNNNGHWDPGEGEQWFYTGTDGKFNEEEVKD